MNESLYLGKFRGIRLGANWSLLPIFLLIAWSLADTLLPSAAPGYTTWGYWLFGLLTAAAFYASLVAHELSHAIVARRHGMKVKGIVLWVLGGVAQLEGDTPSPRAELEVAAVGPATSFGIAAIGAIVASVLSSIGVSSLMVSAIAWLAGINAILALFNLLPAFPLDGGRILRGVLWRRWNDRARATAVAVKVGRAGGFVLIGVGVVEFLAGGGALGGIWLALIGWFIIIAAWQEHEHVREQSRAGELRAADAMSRNPVTVPEHSTVAEAIERYVRPSRFVSFPVLDATGHVLGLATTRRMAELPRESWATTPITAAAAPRPELVVCAPDDPLTDVSARLKSSPERRAIVVDGDRLVGILTLSDVSRAISRTEMFGQASAAGDVAASPGTAYANSFLARNRP